MDQSMENKERTDDAERAASRYIAQRETGPWGEQDAAEFDRWLAQSPLHRVVYYRFNAAWQEAGRLKALSAGHPVETHGRRRVAGMTLRAIAATLVIAVSAAAFFFRASLFPFSSYRTDVGGLQAVPLADGSRVTLNTDSVLRIALGKDERRVDLQRGEAFFEVAKDPGRPFVVTAGGQRVVAVGTRFSVRRDSGNLQVIVTEGTVRMEPDGFSASAGQAAVAPAEGEVTLLPRQDKMVLLPAGAIAHAAAGGLIVERKSLEKAEQQLTWRTGVLTFHDTSLADAAAEFNRYNARKIVIRDPVIADLQVGGVFGATQPEPFVRLIHDAFSVHVSEEPDAIVLSSK